MQAISFSSVTEKICMPHLFPMCLLATDNEAMAETVSASSVSCRRASLSEQPSVEAKRCSERQYLPTRDQNRQDSYSKVCI